MSEQEQAANQFAIQRVYVKDLSFESPRAPDSFIQQWKPSVNLEINTSNKKLSDDNYEVVLSVTVTAKGENDEVLYLVEIQQAGIFLIRGFETEQIRQMLGSFCPNILFPYARETADSLVTRGSFPPLMLGPVNFDAIYAQALAQAEAGDANIQ